MKHTTVRMEDNLYREIRLYVADKGIKIYDFIIKAIREKLDREGEKK